MSTTVYRHAQFMQVYLPVTKRHVNTIAQRTHMQIYVPLTEHRWTLTGENSALSEPLEMRLITGYQRPGLLCFPSWACCSHLLMPAPLPDTWQRPKRNPVQPQSVYHKENYITLFFSWFTFMRCSTWYCLHFWMCVRVCVREWWIWMSERYTACLAVFTDSVTDIYCILAFTFRHVPLKSHYISCLVA